MRDDPGGIMLRDAPAFIQLTFDVAGNAAAGDDEFRFHNEVLNKTAQCLVTSRCGTLPDTLRSTVLLTEYSELDYAQIGELLGVAPGTVASRRHRAIERLRRELADGDVGGVPREADGDGVGVV